MDIIVNRQDSVEGIIHNAGPDYLSTLKSNRKQIENASDLKPEVKEKLLQKVDFAIKRVQAPLDFESKLKYIFIPFEIITLYFDSSKGDIDEFQELGFVKKTKQYYLFSTIGMVMYIAVGVAAAFVF